jgi:hypothetical protein
MNIYAVALFVHILGAVLLFAALTVEGVALRQLSRASGPGEAASAAGMLRLNRIVGPLSALGIVGAGLYMTATSWGWRPWLVTGIGAWVLVAAAGAVNGMRLLSLERRLSGAADRADAFLPIRDLLLRVSWSARVGIAFGVLFLMTVKPGWTGAIAAIAIAAAAGAGAGLIASRGGQRNQLEGTP